MNWIAVWLYIVGCFSAHVVLCNGQSRPIKLGDVILTMVWPVLFPIAMFMAIYKELRK